MITKTRANSQLADYFEPKIAKNNSDGFDAAKNVARFASVITVFEHQRLTVIDFRWAADFEWLLAQEFEVFSLKRQRGQWQLKVGHYIGVIILPSGMSLEILPKPIATNNAPFYPASSSHLALNRQWVQQMLTDLFHRDNNRRPQQKHVAQVSTNVQQLPLSPRPPLPLSEWLVQQFMQLLAQYQPAQHYQTSIQNQSTLQGKLLIKEQMRRNISQPHKLVSEVSHLSPDLISNRLIKSALGLLAPLLTRSNYLITWRRVSAYSPYELRQLDTLYLAATRQLAMQPLKRDVLQSAQQLLQWAYWLLQHQLSKLPVGSSLKINNNAMATFSAPRLCLLINMNQAFEQWASLCIAKSFAQHDKQNQTLYQSQHSWLRDKWGHNCLSMRPDLVIGKRATDTNNSIEKNAFICSHVVDIKWKALTQAASISANDAYQLTSYAQAYQAEQVWLVYPVANNESAAFLDNNAQSIQRPTLLKQYGLNEHLTNNPQAELWLMPFNVLTASLNE